MPTAPHTPAQHHYIEAERGLVDLGALGLDTSQQQIEVLVALVHAVLALAGNDDRGRHETHTTS